MGGRLSTTMRKVKLKNEKLYKVLKEREDLFNKSGDITKKMKELETDNNKLLYKVEALNGKISDIAKKEKLELKEFEYISQIGLDKEECFIDIMHMVDANYRTKEEIINEIMEQHEKGEGIFKDNNLANEVKIPKKDFYKVIKKDENTDNK